VPSKPESRKKKMTTRVVAVQDYSSPLFNQLACNRGEVLQVDWAKR
jgi:hypothetical protein